MNASLRLLVAAALFFVPAAASGQDEAPQLRCGIIGLDTSHAIAFTKLLNDAEAPPELAGCRVVAAYPKGSPDIESSVSRVPAYTEEIGKLGVAIVPSIEVLLKQVDVVLLETNDGRPHLEQSLPVLRAGKRMFIDKPLAGSLSDAAAIYEAADRLKAPVFSSSSLRYASVAQQARQGSLGAVTGCDAYSPAPLEKTHPDLFWYGIHGVETLFTVMGPGCQEVTRTHTPGADIVLGKWSDGRLGTFRGIRDGKSGYGGTVFGQQGIATLSGYEGYRPLVVEIVRFFRSGQPPVSAQETLEIYAFMEAADRCKQQGGEPISVPELLEEARREARQRVDQLLDD